MGVSARRNGLRTGSVDASPVFHYLRAMENVTVTPLEAVARMAKARAVEGGRGVFGRPVDLTMSIADVHASVARTC